MGKGKKSQNKLKFIPINDEIIKTLAQDKRTKRDVASNESKLKNNECSSNEKVISKKVLSLDLQYENSSDDKEKQIGKMECDVSEPIYMNNFKVCKEMNKNSHSNEEKKTKNLSSNQNIVNSSECLDDEGKCEYKNNKKIFKDSKKNSKSDKKEKTKECLLDQQSINSSLDEKTDCETNHVIKPEDELEDKNRLSRWSHNVYGHKTSKDNHKDRIQSYERSEDEFKKGRNQSSCRRNAYDNKHKNAFSNNRNNNYKDKSQSNYERSEEKFKNDRNQSSRSLHFSNNKTKNVYDKTSIKNHEHGSQSVSDSFLNEIDEDLFKLPENIALAHCVAEDLRMGAGIAVDFKIKFGGVGKLIDQNLKVGNVGIVNRHNQYVFYLITKKYSKGKPTMRTLEMALESLLSKMKDLKLTKLGIPKIGCGLDGLDWSDVKSLIIKIFAGSGIHISVCIPSKILDRKAPSQLKVCMTSKNLWEMEPQTDIIIFIDLEKIKINDWANDIINKVDNKYPFKTKLLKDIENKKLKSGEILVYSVNNENIYCVIFEQKTYYECVENVFAAKYFKSRKNTNYLAIQSGSFNFDDTFKHIVWIVLIFRSISSGNELWFCGVTECNEHGFSYDTYYKNLSNSNMKNDYSFSSPMSRDNKYNDNNQSSYSAKRRFNNSWNGSSPQDSFDTSSCFEK